MFLPVFENTVWRHISSDCGHPQLIQAFQNLSNCWLSDANILLLLHINRFVLVWFPMVGSVVSPNKQHCSGLTFFTLSARLCFLIYPDELKETSLTWTFCSFRWRETPHFVASPEQNINQQELHWPTERNLHQLNSIYQNRSWNYMMSWHIEGS